MKRILLLIALVTVIGQMTAQTDSPELNKLIDIVHLLRSQNKDDYMKAYELLDKNPMWTPMNELGNVQDMECTPADKVKRFKLNRLLTKAEGNRKYVTSHGDFLNGEDKNYNYSLYERALRTNATAHFKIKGREGKQIFVVVPFEGIKSELSIRMICNDVPFDVQNRTDGLIVLISKEAVRINDYIEIEITNHGSIDESYVILNHNSRK